MRIEAPTVTQVSGRHAWGAAWSLSRREVVRFLRQRHRVIGAVGQPILFWALFGMGLQQTFRLPGDASDASFIEYFFPGTLVLILLFTAIFTTISVIEDRREGFLQSVLTAPIPRWSMLAGKVLGGTAIALMQGLIFLLFGLTLNVSFSMIVVVESTAFMAVSAFALTSIGLAIAWRMDSTQGFHAVMNLLLMPMWLLSGSFFPAPILTDHMAWNQFFLHWLIRCNPVTYCVAGLRQTMFDVSTSVWSPSAGACWIVVVAFAVVSFLLAWWTTRRPTMGDGA